MGSVIAPIVVEDGAWIASHARIAGNVTVGQEAMVALGAVVFSDCEPRGTYRADNLSLLSLRADKSFQINGARRASFIVELHNALNSSAGQVGYGTVTRGNASQAAFDAARLTVSYFGRVQEIVAPRVLKIGLKLDF